VCSPRSELRFDNTHLHHREQLLHGNDKSKSSLSFMHSFENITRTIISMYVAIDHGPLDMETFRGYSEPDVKDEDIFLSTLPDLSGDFVKSVLASRHGNDKTVLNMAIQNMVIENRIHVAGSVKWKEKTQGLREEVDRKPRLAVISSLFKRCRGVVGMDDSNITAGLCVMLQRTEFIDRLVNMIGGFFSDTVHSNTDVLLVNVLTLHYIERVRSELFNRFLDIIMFVFGNIFELHNNYTSSSQQFVRRAVYKWSESAHKIKSDERAIVVAVEHAEPRLRSDNATFLETASSHTLDGIRLFGNMPVGLCMQRIQDVDAVADYSATMRAFAGAATMFMAIISEINTAHSCELKRAIETTSVVYSGEVYSAEDIDQSLCELSVAPPKINVQYIATGNTKPSSTPSKRAPLSEEMSRIVNITSENKTLARATETASAVIKARYGLLLKTAEDSFVTTTVSLIETTVTEMARHLMHIRGIPIKSMSVLHQIESILAQSK
jgi:hypothetical protein